MKFSNDIIVKVAGLLIPIITIIIGVHQFNMSQTDLKILEMKKIFTNDSLDVEQRLREEKIRVYSKISESVGTILAHDAIDSALKTSIENFKQIYYGQALIVEDSSVNEIMHVFRLSVDDYMGGFITKIVLNNIGMELCDSLRCVFPIKKNVYR